MYPGAFLETHPDKPALIMAGSGFTQTFAELDAAANRLSRLLRAAGLQPGDHIAMCLENHDRYLEIVWGCHYAGLVYTCASSRLCLLQANAVYRLRTDSQDAVAVKMTTAIGPATSTVVQWWLNQPM